jgi:hypothetical protein
MIPWPRPKKVSLFIKSDRGIIKEIKGGRMVRPSDQRFWLFLLFLRGLSEQLFHRLGASLNDLYIDLADIG